MRHHDRMRGAIRLLVHLALLAGTVRAADDASDKIRLLSVDVQPSLLILGEVRAS